MQIFPRYPSRFTLFITEICIVYITWPGYGFVLGQDMDSDQFLRVSSHEERGLGRKTLQRQSSISSEHQFSHGVPLSEHHSTHKQGASASVRGKSISLDPLVYHSPSETDSIFNPFLQPDETARGSFSAHTSFQRVPEFDDMSLSRDSSSEYQQAVRIPKNLRKKKLQRSSDSFGSISRDFLRSEHGESIDRDEEDIPVGDHSGASGVDDQQQRRRDFTEERHRALQSRKISADEEANQRYRHQVLHRHFNNERHHPLEDGRILVREQEEHHRSGRPSVDFSKRGPHSRHSHLGRSHDEEGELSVRNSATEDTSHESESSYPVGRVHRNSHRYPSHQTSSRNEHHEEENPLESVYSPHEYDSFPSNNRPEHRFSEYPDSPRENEHSSVKHQELSPHSQLQVSEYPDSNTGDELFPDTYQRNSPEDTSSLGDEDEELTDPRGEDRPDYPPLEPCSEEIHKFYDGAISPSSPVYEMETYLPRNFNESFLEELLGKFRQYKHPRVGNRNSVCDPGMEFNDVQHSNVRAVCPFQWEVANYHAARYPPYLLTARCLCQVSKGFYGRRGVCEERKGRLSVLWRVGCNNGRHVFMEGWDEINVACVPVGDPLLPGEPGVDNAELYQKAN